VRYNAYYFMYLRHVSLFVISSVQSRSSISFYSVPSNVEYFKMELFIAGMHGEIGECAERSNLPHFNRNDIDSDHGDPRFDTCFNLLLRRRLVR